MWLKHLTMKKEEKKVWFPFSDHQSLPSKDLCQAEKIPPVCSERRLHNEFQHNTMIMRLMPALQSNLQTFRGNLGFWMLRSPQTEGEYTVQVHSKMFHHNNVNLIFREDNSLKVSKVVSNKLHTELQCYRMQPGGKLMALYERAIWTRFHARYLSDSFSRPI